MAGEQGGGLDLERLRERVSRADDPIVNVGSKSFTHLLDELDRLRGDNVLLRGAMDAQDERERKAGEVCGVSFAEHGCDWPEWVAEEVVSLRIEIARLRRSAAERCRRPQSGDSDYRKCIVHGCEWPDDSTGVCPTATATTCGLSE